ncbi:MAG: hypothetical protein HKN91_02770 [Acidimicrobiia bacterium]|nr:hypothetical protein [Acidimicrobiia bacterium]
MTGNGARTNDSHLGSISREDGPGSRRSLGHRADALVIAGSLLIVVAVFLPWVRFGPQALQSATLIEVRDVWAMVWLAVTAAAMVVSLLVTISAIQARARSAAFILVSFGFLVAVRDALGHQDIMGRGISAAGYGTVIAALGCLVAGLGLQLLRSSGLGSRD